MGLLLACRRRPRHNKNRLTSLSVHVPTHQLRAHHIGSHYPIFCPPLHGGPAALSATSLVSSEFPSVSNLSPLGWPLMGLCMRSNATSMACMTKLISTSSNMPELQGLLCAHTSDMQYGAVHLSRWRMPHMNRATAGVINVLSHLQQPDRSCPKLLHFQVLLRQKIKHSFVCEPLLDEFMVHSLTPHPKVAGSMASLGSAL